MTVPQIDSRARIRQFAVPRLVHGKTHVEVVETPGRRAAPTSDTGSGYVLGLNRSANIHSRERLESGTSDRPSRRSIMSLGTVLLIILILLLIGALPTWPYSSGWGYYPSGGIGLVLVIIVILLLVGRI
jgi:hypothetical protein